MVEVAGTPRRLGVEEELLLVDPVSGALVPAGPQVVAACAGRTGAGAEVKPEFFLCQVESASRPHRDLTAVGHELAEARARVAAAAAAAGAVPVAVPGPVLPLPDGGAARVTPGPRYARIDEEYGAVARASLMCALHVHVEVEDDEEGVAVIDRVRPWVPLLVALSANSPYWAGSDTGYESWRARVWGTWPSSGPAELFHDAAGYHRATAHLVETGGASDVALVNYDVRLSARHPTIEYRVADVCTDLGDALVLAALARALTGHAARQYREGVPPAPWRVEALRSAAWRAARFGLTGTLVSPGHGRQVPAAEALDELVTTVRDELAAAGDLDRVTRALASPAPRAAQRQRAVHAATGLPGVLADLAARTAGESPLP
jgi:carboxylate-amine ligase